MAAGGDDDQRFDLPDDPPPAHPPARPIQGGRVDRRALAAAGLALAAPSTSPRASTSTAGSAAASASTNGRRPSPPAATPSSAPRQAAFAAAAPPEATAAAAASPGSPSTCRRTALQLLDLQVPEQWRRDDGEVDVVDLVVSHPAARRVEELRVRVVPCSGVYSLSASPSSPRAGHHRVQCTRLALPSAAAAAFPRRCVVRLWHLQRLIDAAPGLTTVHLESVSVYFDFGCSATTPTNSDSDESEEEESFAGDDTGPGGESGSESDTAEEARLLLRCPAATTPVLALCNSSTYNNDNGGGCIAIDAPKLRSLHNLESSSPARRDESRAPPHFPRPRAPQAELICVARRHCP
uniref:Uncharacterized protein n=1 Tax=Oryza barthii TaxID=65489 RepID=A0A0D3HDM5_9ORYZ